jgi:hypothetical protein
MPIRVLGGKNALATLPVQSLVIQLHSLEEAATILPVAAQLGLLDDLTPRHRDEFTLLAIELT